MGSPPRSATEKLLNRIDWLMLIWAASVVALGAITLILRVLMSATGMTV